MKKCSDCNVDMVEDTDLHTDYVSEESFEQQIYLSYISGTRIVKNIFGKEKEKSNRVTERIRARVCPNCGKVELFVNTK